jgi:ATP-dependent protease ClpP protease subunit
MKKIVLALVLASTGLVAQAADVEFTKGNSYTLSGPVTDESVDAAIVGVSPSEVKYLVLETPGGSVDAGYRFVSFLKTKPNLICVVQSAASMGFVILQACGKRYVLDHSILMQHQASLGLPQTKVKNLLSVLKGILNQLWEMDMMQAKRMGLTVEQFDALTTDDLWIFSGARAVELNAADKVVTASCSPELLSKKLRRKETIQVFIFQMDVEVEYSECPLILTKKIIEPPAPPEEEAPAKK